MSSPRTAGRSAPDENVAPRPTEHPNVLSPMRGQITPGPGLRIFEDLPPGAGSGVSPIPLTGCHLLQGVVDRMVQEFRVTEVWGFTSLFHLHLVPCSNLDSPSRVFIQVMDGHLSIHYRPPSARQLNVPWIELRKTGEVEDAFRLVRSAMALCGCWQGSEEVYGFPTPPPPAGIDRPNPYGITNR